MGKKMYVGNMSYDTTAEKLREVFGAYGEVTDVHIVTDRDTGRPRGFAFVEMSSDAEAAAAIAAVNGQSVDGRELRVDEARPRRSFGGGGGGSRGGGRGGYGGGDRRSNRSSYNDRW